MDFMKELQEVLRMFSQQLKRLAGPALIAGGLLWVAAAVSSVITGMLTGKVNPYPGTLASNRIHRHLVL